VTGSVQSSLRPYDLTCDQTRLFVLFQVFYKKIDRFFFYYSIGIKYKYVVAFRDLETLIICFGETEIRIVVYIVYIVEFGKNMLSAAVPSSIVDYNDLITEIPDSVFQRSDGVL